MSAAVPIGSLARSDAAVIAGKAAREIAASATGHHRAVTVDPRGRVAVEPVRSAAEADLLGVYVAPRVGAWVGLAAQIERDLRCELSLRGKRRAA